MFIHDIEVFVFAGRTEKQRQRIVANEMRLEKLRSELETVRIHVYKLSLFKA